METTPKDQEQMIREAAEKDYPLSSDPHINTITVFQRLAHQKGVKSECARQVWEPKWIDVSDRMPEQHSKNVFALTNTGMIRITWVDKRTKEFDVMELDEENSEHYTHWQPLPSSPNQTKL